MKRKPYPSDTTKEQFDFIEEFLKISKHKSGRKFTYSMKDIFDSMLYIKATGCHWRSLPHDFNVPWDTVYYHFKKFNDNDTFEIITSKLNQYNREEIGKKKNLVC